MNQQLYDLLDKVEALAELDGEELARVMNEIGGKFNEIVLVTCKNIDLQMKDDGHLAPNNDQNSEAITRIKHLVSVLMLTELASTAKKIDKLIEDKDLLSKLDEMVSASNLYTSYQEGLRNPKAFETIGVFAFMIGYGLGCEGHNEQA